MRKGKEKTRSHALIGTHPPKPFNSDRPGGGGRVAWRGSHRRHNTVKQRYDNTKRQQNDRPAVLITAP